jgi:hypothetical protein
MESIEEQMSKAEIIASFENILKNEAVWNQEKSVKVLGKQFFELQRIASEENRKIFEAQEEKEAGDSFEISEDALDHRWKELVNIYKEKIEGRKKSLAEEEKQNFEKKEALVGALKTLVEAEMKNIGASFASFYSIRDQWNETGQVNKSKFKHLQYDYSHYRELFYYNVGIHDELKSYDLKKNAEQKQAIVNELKALNDQDSIKKMEKGVKELQAKWDEIGPTVNEVWEQLKNDYWDTVNSVYEKVKIHYKALRETQAKVLEEKSGLIEKMEGVQAAVTDFKTPKQWIDLTDKVNDLHAEWKAAGFLGRSKEETIWTQFKGISDELRTQKNTFFDDLKKENGKVIEAKDKLIEQAEALKDSTEWKKTSEELIALQKKWKQSGKGQYKTDQKQWEQFRVFCDAFFAAKKTYYDTLDDRQEANFKEKEVIANKITKSKSEAELKILIREWQAVDYVPKNKINAVEASLKKSIDSVAKELKINADDLGMLQFEAKIAALKEDSNAVSKVRAETEFIQTQIDKVKEEIHRFEENMGFFGHSKGSQKLKEIVEKRMEVAAEKLQEWKDKIEMLK